MTNWSLKDLDLTKAFEVIPSRDPAKALRITVPVPNWLDESGQPRFSHENIRRNPQDGSWRFYFYNFKDDCDQGVRIDGSSVITFMGAGPETAKRLIALVGEYAADAEQLTPEQLTDILSRSHSELKLGDRFNKKRANVDSYMTPYAPLQTAHRHLGAFLPQPTISTAVYLSGEGYYLDGPTATPQQFDDGAFISFPGWGKQALLAVPRADLNNSKLVQAGVFTDTRTHADGRAILIKDMTPQVPPVPGAGGPPVFAPQPG